ncbi:hypothetical protein AVEN_232627-1, partial [Araneus ventricosus]
FCVCNETSLQWPPSVLKKTDRSEAGHSRSDRTTPFGLRLTKRFQFSPHPFRWDIPQRRRSTGLTTIEWRKLGDTLKVLVDNRI